MTDKEQKDRKKRSRRFDVRLNDQEWEKLRAFAESKDIAMAEAVRDWIKSLPDS